MKQTADRIPSIEMQPDHERLPNRILDSTMQSLVAEVAGDAAKAPHEYLRDTIVPEGGE